MPHPNGSRAVNARTCPPPPFAHGGRVSEGRRKVMSLVVSPHAISGKALGPHWGSLLELLMAREALVRVESLEKRVRGGNVRQPAAATSPNRQRQQGPQSDDVTPHLLARTENSRSRRRATTASLEGLCSLWPGCDGGHPPNATCPQLCGLDGEPTTGR